MNPTILDALGLVCNQTLQKVSHNTSETKKKMGKIRRRSSSATGSKRSRTPNWSPHEKQFLLELIRQRKDVVVTKNNSGPMHYEGKDAWNEILRELGSKYGDKFSASSVKKVKTQWQNMKRIARDEISQHGPAVQNYTQQTIEVCNILDLVKDGVLVLENEAPNAPNTTIPTTNVVIKTERIDHIDEDYTVTITDIEPNNATNTIENVTLQQKEPTSVRHSEDTGSSYSEQGSEMDEDEPMAPVTPPQPKRAHQGVSAMTMTETSLTEPSMTETPYFNSLHRELKEFMRFSAAQKQLRIETLKEERQVMRAMRETAELNKIIAEQRLKHLLWMKRQEMTMYSGEPGSGAGKGGGGGGSIREAGGSFGKMEAAREDEYFYKKQKEQLNNLKSHFDKEIAFHQEQIKRHEDAIRRHKAQQDSIEHK